MIEAAEAMRDESQNALLKTLEEPPPHAHLILLSAEPESLLETITSRCQEVRFAALPAAAIAAALEGTAEPDEVATAANLSAGDLDRARFLLSEPGAEIRSEAESCAGAALAGTAGSAPWSALLASAEAAGEEAEAATRDALEAEKELGVAALAEGVDGGGAALGPTGGAPRFSISASSCAVPGYATWWRSAPGPRRSSSTATGSTSCAERQRGSTPPGRGRRSSRSASAAGDST